MAWNSASDLALALGETTYAAIFDDGNGGINLAAVAQVLRAAHADVMRYALRGYDGAIPNPPPDELVILELDFARARAFMRGDAYTRDTGKELWTASRDTGKDIAASLQRGGEDMPNPTPALSEPNLEPPTTSSATPVSATGDFFAAWSDNGWFWRKEGRQR